MKIIVKHGFSENIFTFELFLVPNSEESKLLKAYGEPFINASFGDRPKNLKKVYSDFPLLIANESQSDLITHKNELVEKIRISITDLKTKHESVILEDEIIEF
jgi:hypothetical protein